MRTSLTFQGELTYDLMQEGIDDGSFWVEDNDYIIVHLDSDVRQNLKSNKSLRRGFVNIFRIAVECLKANKVPSAENLEWCSNNRSEWPPHSKNYLRRAGTQMGCRAVLRYMFKTAKEWDEKAGNGECQLTLEKKWSDLPTCRNDHEFEFVARSLVVVNHATYGRQMVNVEAITCHFDYGRIDEAATNLGDFTARFG
ncbi:hypothetical protein N7445_006150 [Penicillium cf. griseofulvum]|nr:hypothetical protein N7445_006150 [Penicillium cf. griseofulvum]